MRTNRAIRLVALTTLGLGIAGPCFAVTPELTGIVQELGQPAGKNGVSGVFIQVKDKGDVVLATGTTDGMGQYRIPLPPGVVAQMMEFKKIKFRALPTIRTITDPKKPQRPVLLIREGQPDEYYAALWDQVYRLGRDEHTSALIAIRALDTADRDRLYALRDRTIPQNVASSEDRTEFSGAVDAPAPAAPGNGEGMAAAPPP